MPTLVPLLSQPELHHVLLPALSNLCLDPPLRAAAVKSGCVLNAVEQLVKLSAGSKFKYPEQKSHLWRLLYTFSMDAPGRSILAHANDLLPCVQIFLCGIHRDIVA